MENDISIGSVPNQHWTLLSWALFLLFRDVNENASCKNSTFATCKAINLKCDFVYLIMYRAEYCVPRTHKEIDPRSVKGSFALKLNLAVEGKHLRG
jgi:hypothetical protein